jgi:hypothetical protein
VRPGMFLQFEPGNFVFCVSGLFGGVGFFVAAQIGGFRARLPKKSSRYVLLTSPTISVAEAGRLERTAGQAR